LKCHRRAGHNRENPIATASTARNVAGGDAGPERRRRRVDHRKEWRKRIRDISIGVEQLCEEGVPSYSRSGGTIRHGRVDPTTKGIKGYDTLAMNHSTHQSKRSGQGKENLHDGIQDTIPQPLRERKGSIFGQAIRSFRESELHFVE
jgi:hypothetical protein